jgi:hypothetical protein
MNGSMRLNSTGFSAGINPVFSPAVRFAPKELSLSQVIRLTAYWASIIAITLVMVRSGFSYARHAWSERPSHHSVR